MQPAILKKLVLSRHLQVTVIYVSPLPAWKFFLVNAFTYFPITLPAFIPETPMPSIIHYNGCPVCGSPDIAYALTALDHTVTGERFDIYECKTCSLRFTQDVPDANSISRYYESEDYISHSNTSKGLVNRLYQIVRKRTLVSKRSLVSRFTGMKKGSVLDYGSGVGAFANEMREAGWTVTALEPESLARQKARDIFNLELRDVTDLFSLPAASFDAITLWHVLEHVHQLHACIKQLRILLKPGGVLFIAVPNYNSKDAKIYRSYWAAYDVPRHLYHFTPAAMENLMKGHGLHIKRYAPMWFDSFYISMLSSRYKSGTVKLLKSFFNGLSSNLGAMTNHKKCSSVVYVIRHNDPASRSSTIVQG